MRGQINNQIALIQYQIPYSLGLVESFHILAFSRESNRSPPSTSISINSLRRCNPFNVFCQRLYIPEKQSLGFQFLTNSSRISTPILFNTLKGVVPAVGYDS